MIACVPVDPNGNVDPRWGRADRIAIIELNDDRIESWHEIDVAWSQVHDAGTPAQHHARVARFLKSNRVELVVADHVGEGMVRMLTTMHVSLALGAGGDARSAVEGASRSCQRLIVETGVDEYRREE
ncbi:MAG: NifB/NifX family molybdenum-iron cluster-binding protein [Acidimicrobiales bacterium]